MNQVLRQLSEDWFLREPAFFALYCQQQLTENVRMDCAVRCGQGRLEYNPLILRHKNYADVEQLMRIEMIRLFLKHPYERQPEGCCREAMSIGSDIAIADGYCLLHKEKLPLHDPSYYHLPLGQYYEWYAKQIQQQSDSDSSNSQSPSPQSENSPQSNQSSSNQSSDNQSSDSKSALASKSQLWREDDIERQKINSLIERTTDWGSLPSDIVERIKASTGARIRNRLIWQGFHSAVLSSQRHLTRMRPNRRTSFQQMGSTRQFDTRLLVAVDVSGSITGEVLNDFFSCVNRIFRYGVAQIDLCTFDAALSDVQTLHKAMPEIEVHGRGGTDFQPLFDFIRQTRTDYDGMIILTDGQANPPVISGHIPLVLWVCQDKPTYDASHDWMQKTGRCCYLI